MASLADILRQRTGGMVWDTPSGAQSVPGYQFAGQPDTSQAPFMPSSGASAGYAAMFDAPVPQDMPPPRAGNPGLLSMMVNGTDIPNGAPPPRQGLLDMLGRVPASGMMGPAPIPMPRPIKPDAYTVRKGDTLTSIAKRYGTTVKALMAKNPQIKNANKIVAGKTRIQL